MRVFAIFIAETVNMKGCLTVGVIESKPSGNFFPLAIPLKTCGTVIVEFDPDDEKHNPALEKWVIDAIRADMNTSVVKFSTGVVDNHPALSLLQRIGKCIDYAGGRNIELGFQILLDNAIKRRNNITQAGFLTIDDYNKNQPETLSTTIVIIPNFEVIVRASKMLGYDEITDLLINSLKYGLYFILLTNGQHTPSSRLPIDSKEFTELIRIYTQWIPRVNFHKDSTSVKFGNPIDKKKNNRQFNIKFHESTTSENIKHVFYFVNKIEGDATQKNRDFVRIPIGTANGKPIFFSLGESSMTTHAAISGTTRSGKSTILEMVILAILENYTETKININIVDFKRILMARSFLQNPNPIISGVLEVSPTFNTIKSLFRRYKNIIHQRMDYIRSQGFKKISAFNQKHPDKELPYLLIIIDEAHNIFQKNATTLDNMRLGTEIEDILRESGAAGVHFVFCTQTFRGTDFTEPAKSQIQLRIACKAGSSGDSVLMVGNEDAHKIVNDPDRGIYKFIHNTQAGLENSNIEAIASVLNEEEFEARLRNIKKHDYAIPIINADFFHEDEVGLKEVSGEERTLFEDKFNSGDINLTGYEHMPNISLTEMAESIINQRSKPSQP